MRGWLISPKWLLAMGAAAKAGSTTLARLYKTNSALRLNVPDVRHGREDWSMVPRDPAWRRVGVIRHPVARFYSLWHNVQERKRGGGNNFYNQFVGKSPEALLDGIVAAGLDYEFHFQPQYRIGFLELKAEMVRLESLNVWWKYNKPLGSTDMPIENKSASTAPEPNPALEAAICELYEQDLLLWEGAWDSSTSSPANATLQ